MYAEYSTLYPASSFAAGSQQHPVCACECECVLLVSAAHCFSSRDRIRSEAGWNQFGPNVSLFCGMADMRAPYGAYVHVHGNVCTTEEEEEERKRKKKATSCRD